jgi:hypothetical protein
MIIDKDDVTFRAIIESGFVDKTGLIAHLNNKAIGKLRHFIFMSRPHGFGKSVTIEMLNAYYSKSCNCSDIFDKLKISQDPTYEENLNKHNVLCVDMQSFDHPNSSADDYFDNFHKDLCEDLKTKYPLAFDNCDRYDFVDAIARVNKIYHETFIFLIDNWDYIIRKYHDTELTNYLMGLWSELFKSSQCEDCFSLVYMTGIYPLVKGKTQSDVNNFQEYTMIHPMELPDCLGFTEDETKALCLKSGMSYEEVKEWIGAYPLSGKQIFNPQYVVKICKSKNFALEIKQDEILKHVPKAVRKMVPKGKKLFVELLNKGYSDSRSHYTAFNGDISDLYGLDAMFAYLIHLGYLALDSDQQIVRLINGELKTALTCAFAAGLLAR